MPCKEVQRTAAALRRYAITLPCQSAQSRAIPLLRLDPLLDGRDGFVLVHVEAAEDEIQLGERQRLG